MLIKMLLHAPHQKKEILRTINCFISMNIIHRICQNGKITALLGRRTGFLSHPQCLITQEQPLAHLTFWISSVSDPIRHRDSPQVTCFVLTPSYQPNASAEQTVSRALCPTMCVYTCAHIHMHVGMHAYVHTQPSIHTCMCAHSPVSTSEPCMFLSSP